jgi:hypothetical protein
MSAATPAWPDEVRAVYVLCHPVKERARWERLLPHLLSVGIPAGRIRVCAPTWGTDLTTAQIFAVYDPYLRRGGTPTLTFKGYGLTRGEISLGLNFVAAVKDAVARDEKGLILTLESDTWLRADFVARLRELLASAAAEQDVSGAALDATLKPWDFISLGEGVGTRPPGAPRSYYAPTKAWKPPHNWVFRCTDSMLFTMDYLKRLSKTMLPFKEIIDWEMNFQLLLHKGKALWADPPLAEQGTCFARLPTTLPA